MISSTKCHKSNEDETAGNPERKTLGKANNNGYSVE